MSKVAIQIESDYRVGDVVIFKKSKTLLVGIVEGFYCDGNAGMTVWYNIRTSRDYVYSYSNGGDISEWDIVCKISGESAERIRGLITNQEGEQK